MINARRAHVLMVGEFCCSHVNSTGLYFEQMFHGLKEAYDVSVVSSVISDEVKASAKSFEVTGANLNLIPQIIVPLIRTMLIIRRALRVSKTADIIIIGTNPYWLPQLVRLKPRHCKAIIWCFDLFPENLILSNIKPTGLLSFLRRQFKHAYRGTDSVVCCGRDMEALIRNEYLLGTSVASFYIPNWSPKDDSIS